MKRGFLQISFAWLFGIIAGAAILTFAILAASKVINLGQYQTGAEAQAQFGVLLNPLETGFESGSVTSITSSSETRVYNNCSADGGVFGSQTIGISEKSFNKWPAIPSQGKSFQNKYIFSDNITQGKQFFLFSKPFNFPFKVADLIYMTSSDKIYCFVNPSQSIGQELSNLNEKNIVNSTGAKFCPKESVTVCFSGAGCNISVDENAGTVTKNGTIMYYYGNALMYAAIFGDPSIYECQLSRLMNRESQLAFLYSDKEKLVSTEGCNSNLGQELTSLGSLSKGLKNSKDLNGLSQEVKTLQSENSYSPCALW